MLNNNHNRALSPRAREAHKKKDEDTLVDLFDSNTLQSGYGITTADYACCGRRYTRKE